MATQSYDENGWRLSGSTVTITEAATSTAPLDNPMRNAGPSSSDEAPVAMEAPANRSTFLVDGEPPPAAPMACDEAGPGPPTAGAGAGAGGAEEPVSAGATGLRG